MVIQSAERFTSKPYDGAALRRKCDQEYSQLRLEVSSWLAHWGDCMDYTSPRRARFQVSDTNRGNKRNDKIRNDTATRALRTLKGGMKVGMSSPSAPWFMLIPSNPEYSNVSSVVSWLYEVEQRLYQIYARSNLYNKLSEVYGDLGRVGIALLSIEEDEHTIVRGYVHPIGSWVIARDARGQVCAMYRAFRMTVEQLVEKFGEDAVSIGVKSQYKAGTLHTYQDVMQRVAVNEKPQDFGVDSRYSWAGCYYEVGVPQEKVLGCEGYYEQPVFAPTWERKEEDVYGTTCPTMDCLGDIKMLQTLEVRSNKNADLGTSPPMKFPSAMEMKPKSSQPGTMTYVDEVQGAGKAEPLYVPDWQWNQMLEAKIERVERRIQNGYFADIFTAMLYQEGSKPTARQVEEVHEEKLLQLGDVWDSLQQEYDLINHRIIGVATRRGFMPPPPPELEMAGFSIEYTSLVGQAREVLEAQKVGAVVSFAGGMAAIMPEALDVIDATASVKEYHRATGAPPSIIRSDEDIAARRAAREKQAQQQQALAMAQQGADTAQTLGATNTTNQNALTDIAGAIAP